MDASLSTKITTVYVWYNKLGLSYGARERRKVKTDREEGRRKGEKRIRRRGKNMV